MFLGSGALPVRKSDNLTAICELSRQCGILNISQPYEPPQSVNGDSFFFSWSQIIDVLKIYVRNSMLGSKQNCHCPALCK
jgi:hypothetical protein